MVPDPLVLICGVPTDPLVLIARQAGAVAAVGKVEAKTADSLKELRGFELQHHRMVMLKEVAADCTMVICGDTGEEMLQNLTPGGDADLSVTRPLLEK